MLAYFVWVGVLPPNKTVGVQNKKTKTPPYFTWGGVEKKKEYK